MPQQPLPKEGEKFDATPLELSHVNLAMHDTWLRAISIVWNTKLNEIPWKFEETTVGDKTAKRWVQLTGLTQEQINEYEASDAENTDGEPKDKTFYKTYKAFLIGNPLAAFGVLGFNDPDEYARECQPAALPPISVICATDALERIKKVEAGIEANETPLAPSLEAQILRRFKRYANLSQTRNGALSIEEYLQNPYEFKQGENGWYTQDETAPALLLSQLVLVIPPSPKDPQDQAMALADYKLAGLSYPCTMCAQ